MIIRQYAYDLAYPDAPAREAVTLTAGHVGKVARQLDDGSYWYVSSTVGPDPVWERMPGQELSYDPVSGILTNIETGLKYLFSTRLYIWSPNDYGAGQINSGIELHGREGSVTPGVAGDGLRLRFSANTDDGNLQQIASIFAELVDPAAAAHSAKATLAVANGAGDYAKLVLDGSDLSLKVFNGAILDRMVETGWIDVPCRIEQATGAAALTIENYRDTEFVAYFMRHDQDDKISLEWQMPHGWDLQSVRPHLHIEPQSDPVAQQNIRFSGKYVWSKRGEATPADAAWTTFTVDHPVDPGDVFIQRTVSLATVAPPASPAPSDILMMWVKRLGQDAADTYTTAKTGGTAAANLKISSIDAHVHVTKTGTSTEF
jgi:hypothetical protein